jgi:hypothetical protein
VPFAIKVDWLTSTALWLDPITKLIVSPTLTINVSVEKELPTVLIV